MPLEYTKIQDAIDAAQTGDTVLVANGIYQGSPNAGIVFQGRDIALISEQGAAETVLDGAGNAGTAVVTLNEDTRARPCCADSPSATGAAIGPGTKAAGS